MFKKSRPCREALQDYRNRNYVLSELDNRHFDAMNKGSGDVDPFLYTAGCLDALEDMPAGSTYNSKYDDRFFYFSSFERERTAAEVKAFDDFMNGLDDE
jgi:hypothetical protein